MRRIAVIIILCLPALLPAQTWGWEWLPDDNYGIEVEYRVSYARYIGGITTFVGAENVQVCQPAYGQWDSKWLERALKNKLREMGKRGKIAVLNWQWLRYVGSCKTKKK
ncbi:MAG: hypothetical protein D6751_07335 [Deltaproteobacteria bacterium]|nr:MAG: hypothetical protein D6751_07335 [Deltaproteobacteria bacterium]